MRRWISKNSAQSRPPTRNCQLPTDNCQLPTDNGLLSDFADVVELIAIRKLAGFFARFLHSSLRDTCRQLERNATDAT